MCGIAGFFDPRRSCDPGAYDGIAGAMADRLAHRGPDDRGVWSDAAAGIALGFRRLSILDLSNAGHQPMLSADGDRVLVFNGEIYNHRALRHELTTMGAAPWRGHSDSEVLLAAIARWGFAEALMRLDGMFAIALWDRKARRLWLARDRFGEKPLYWGWSGGVLLFASELKALAAHPAWSGALDRGALALFLARAYVPAPWSAFAGIGKLLPGCFASIGASGEAEVNQPYWSARERAAAAAAAPFEGGLGAAAERLQELIDHSVALRMEADVPLGVFLSGGIDSSTVVAAMQHAGRGTARSFSVAFRDPRFDESRHAAAVARHLGTDHTEIGVSEGDCLDVLPCLAEIYDEPFADASEIPTAVLCRVTREHVKVSLSGDGGDELFGGYPRYATAAAQWRRIEGHPRWRRAARQTAALLAGRHGRLTRRWRKLAEGWGHARPTSLYRDHVSRWRAGEGLVPGLCPATLFDEPPPAGPPSLEQRFMLIDALTYLPDDLLVKVDRASMAVGLETRAPLLDHRIAEFAWSLPPALMLAGGEKRMLREVLYRRVPRALVDRPKQGFEPPIGDWLRQGLRDWADDLLSPARLARTGLLDPQFVAARWREHRSGRRNWTYPLWTVLMLEAWLEHRTGGRRR
jgi:asparagine synthase (glutamine-hydrolysing)